MNLTSLPLGARILVTGANGFIATHTINELLKLGYSVRGTVRTAKPWLDAHFATRYGPHVFQTAIVSNFGDSDQITAVLNDVDAIVHLVSDVTMSESIREVAPWSRKAAVTILDAASRRRSIRSVVMGSSSMAVYSPSPGKRSEDEASDYAQDTWNTSAIREAWATTSSIKGDGSHADWNRLATLEGDLSSRSSARLSHMLLVYSACKTLCEREAWAWVQNNRPSFKFNTVVPAFTCTETEWTLTSITYKVGRVLHPNIPGSTMGWVRSLLSGNRTPIALIPPKWFVDVEDVARLFVIALLGPTVRSERVFAFGESLNWTDVTNILRKIEPHNSLIPVPDKGEKHDLAEILPRARAVKLLQLHYGQIGMTQIATSIAGGIKENGMLQSSVMTEPVSKTC